MTPGPQAAAAASAAFAIGEAASRAARTRERATVGRSGVLPVLRKPHFGCGAAVASGARTAMRNTPPRGERVQRATQSMKSRSGLRSGGQSRTSTIDLRLSPPPARVAQTTPVAIRVPSGMATNCPGSSRSRRGRDSYRRCRPRRGRARRRRCAKASRRLRRRTRRSCPRNDHSARRRGALILIPSTRHLFTRIRAASA